MKLKICIGCGDKISKPYQVGVTAWNKRKYCNPKCYWKNKHDEPWNKGLKLPHLSGANSYQWKGDKVSYIGLHAWVSKKLGKPSMCEFCLKTDGRFEWANKSHQYKRDLNDWIRLCYSCHEKYDQVWVGRERDRLGRFI